MLVTPPVAARIASGRKQQHRIPQHRVAPARQRIPISTRRVNVDTGITETMTVCYVKVLEVVPSIIGEITAAELSLEGYRSREALLSEWPDERAPVWVLSLELDRTYIPRYLSLGVVAGRQGDYTENARRCLDPEAGEAVGDDELLRFAREARLRHEIRIHGAREALKALTIREQVDILRAEARARHIDVRDQVRQIERYADREDIVSRQLSRMREKLGHAA